MPKRKRKCSDSDYDYIVKKLKKLEQKLKRGRKRRHSESDRSDSIPDCDNRSPEKSQEIDAIVIEDDVANDCLPGCSYWSDLPLPSENTYPPPVDTAPPPPAVAPPPAAVPPPPATAPPRPAPTTTTAAAATEPAASGSAATQTSPELDADLLEILGEDPTSTKEYGTDIQKDLAIRLNHIATSGLSKENRKELKDKYLIPGNCKLIKAPALNPEIRAALIESQAKRDKGIENKQVLTSCALSSLGAAITILLSAENKNPEVLKLLMDTARTLGDIQHADSILRRFFILSTVKKDLKDQLEKTKIDEMLFGKDLSETLKSAKIINKSGADLRSTVKSNNTQKSSKAPLNSKAPPAKGRQPATSGAERAARHNNSTPTPRQTTTTPAPRSASRTSSRPQQGRYRR